MNSKCIKAVLTKQINSWLESIKDENVRKLAAKNVIVTGGSIVSMLLKEEVKDYDIYFRNKETTKAVAEYYVKRFNDAQGIDGAVARVLDGAEEFAKSLNASPAMWRNMTPDRIKIYVASKGVAAENPEVLKEPVADIFEALDKADSVSAEALEEKEKYRPVFLSSNAITLSNKIQLVMRFYGEPKEIHKNYDFVHCTNYWTSWDNKLVLQPLALESILNKELKYVGSLYPVCSVIRTRKFLARGWMINAGQYLKMLFQVSQLDLTDINVLEDQLVGVDSSYFNCLIEALQDKKEKDPTFVIDNSYLSTIIDKIF